MRNLIDFSSLPSLFSTLIGLLLASLVMVGIRLVFMQVMQRRRERENRQINERLKTLIAAYKTLGGSFTGRLQVSPTHMRDLSEALPGVPEPAGTPADEDGVAAVPAQTPAALSSSERQRRIRDAVEAALSDVILLGTEEQVGLAARAAQDMVAGRSVETAELVVSLRRFIRAALDLEPIPDAVLIPRQGPLRPGGAGGAGGGRRDGGAGGGRGGGGGGGGGGAGGGAMAMGAGMHHAAGDAAVDDIAAAPPNLR
ncbi:hypothetical protein FOZ76_05550 [Verticiella sediminum]|uniref:Uncharacterized protein n=1 Tax=Verticiella sediminum TaxID=1247510 RepID=A0A556AXF8_9BURK|nr:hypothetical protein [Verticiella sediminum]TSH97620.1 hypothetical protein FOZ76_05550 [Verticiella sediminum]